MCESCESGISRRDFLAASGTAGGAAVLGGLFAPVEGRETAAVLPPREKKPARVAVVFLYPPAEVVLAGQNEDAWRVHQWFTWPGNQFEPERQEELFSAKIREMADRLGITADFAPKPLYQEGAVAQYIEAVKASAPDAVLVVNFWNTFAPWSHRIATEAAPAAIVYQPVGSNHQLPPQALRDTPGLFYIHSIENWAEIERGLRAVRAKKMLAQSRLLRVSGRVEAMTQAVEPDLETEVVTVPAQVFNDIFDAAAADEGLIREAMQWKAAAAEVRDVTDEYCVEAFRAHRAVREILARYGADAVTIECLFLKHRKPCVSFAINNGDLIPCGCENQLDGTLTQMLGRWLWDRAGFMHNPEFDTSENRYFGAHCTCATKLHGPEGPAQPFLIRPFFHQMPKTAALDVQWPENEPVILAKYYSGQKRLCCWTGRSLGSPTCPPTGGCATRVLVEIDRVQDVCEIYPGIHPILFCGSPGDARAIKVFARMYRLELLGNV